MTCVWPRQHPWPSRQALDSPDTPLFYRTPISLSDMPSNSPRPTYRIWKTLHRCFPYWVAAWVTHESPVWRRRRNWLPSSSGKSKRGTSLIIIITFFSWSLSLPTCQSAGLPPQPQAASQHTNQTWTYFVKIPQLPITIHDAAKPQSSTAIQMGNQNYSRA